MFLSIATFILPAKASLRFWDRHQYSFAINLPDVFWRTYIADSTRIINNNININIEHWTLNININIIAVLPGDIGSFAKQDLARFLSSCQEGECTMTMSLLQSHSFSPAFLSSLILFWLWLAKPVKRQALKDTDSSNTKNYVQPPGARCCQPWTSVVYSSGLASKVTWYAKNVLFLEMKLNKIWKCLWSCLFPVNWYLVFWKEAVILWMHSQLLRLGLGPELCQLLRLQNIRLSARLGSWVQ